MTVQISVQVNGRSYPVTCAPGQEDLVRASARLLDERVQGFVKIYGQPSESHLLVLAGLMLAAELGEGKAPKGDPAADAKAVAGIDAVAQRLDAIAGRLERA